MYINAHMSQLLSKTVLGVCNHIYNSNWHAHLGNETRADPTVQMDRLSFPLVVRIWHKLVFWREIKTPAHLRHCRDSSKVKSLHLGPAMSPESPAPREPEIQMTGALVWNSVPLEIKQSSTIESFTNNCLKWMKCDSAS